MQPNLTLGENPGDVDSRPGKDFPLSMSEGKISLADRKILRRVTQHGLPETTLCCLRQRPSTVGRKSPLHDVYLLRGWLNNRSAASTTFLLCARPARTWLTRLRLTFASSATRCWVMPRSRRLAAMAPTPSVAGRCPPAVRGRRLDGGHGPGSIARAARRRRLEVGDLTE